ncbi:hypothetical protein [Companilactobacillus sp. HBUAS56275]
MDSQFGRNLNMFNDIDDQRLLSVVGGHWYNDFIKGFNEHHRFW